MAATKASQRAKAAPTPDTHEMQGTTGPSEELQLAQAQAAIASSNQATAEAEARAAEAQLENTRLSRSTREMEEREPSREHEARAAQEVELWTEPSKLEAPVPRAGFRQRWIAAPIPGNNNHSHYARRMREGWKPRPVDTIPDSFHAPTSDHGSYEGFLEVQGMVLCEMPIARVRARENYFHGKTQQLERSTEVQMDAEGRKGGIPIQREELASGVKLGGNKGRVSQVADDI